MGDEELKNAAATRAASEQEAAEELKRIAAAQASVNALKKQKASAEKNANNLFYVAVALCVILTSLLLTLLYLKAQVPKPIEPIPEPLIAKPVPKPFEGTWIREDGR